MARHPRRELFLANGMMIGREDGLPVLMGIVNITPDSFSDGGKFLDPEAAIAHGKRLMDEGADILDLGAESTRPGATPLSAEEEWQRLAPVVEGLAAFAPLSIDTMKVDVARKALEAGATMINDVSAGAASNDEIIALCAEQDAPICLMHMKGEPQTMQDDPKYDNILKEVHDFLAERREKALSLGINEQRLVVDPGFGFGKTHGHNVLLVRHLDRFRKLGLCLMGLSRKRTLAWLSREESDQDRLPESLAGAIMSTLHGADIMRVHDVGATRRALRVSVPFGLS